MAHAIDLFERSIPHVFGLLGSAGRATGFAHLPSRQASSG